MNRTERRMFRKAFDQEQASQPWTLKQVPRDKWPKSAVASAVASAVSIIEVWRSRKYLVVLYQEPCCLRMTINRAELGAGGWKADLTWDEIQMIKDEIGRGKQWAVECYPPESEVVNVANMRHLWLLDQEPVFGWKRKVQP